MAGMAEHSTLPFKPAGTYDLVRCDAYWHMHNWAAPIESADISKQQELLKCNAYCAHKTHGGTQVFCEDQALHTKSMSFADHLFPKCSHPSTSVFEIVFVIDITGSMSDKIKQVRDSILQIVSHTYPADVSFKFAVVCFTDHDGECGDLNPTKPTKVFPTSGVVDNGTPNEVAQFLSTLRTSGGGSSGEGVLCGLYDASRLEFNATSKKLVFLATDDRPHGREFGTNPRFPDGCPCNVDWRNILQAFKNMQAEFYNIKLNEINEIAREKFTAFYGPSFKTIQLNEAQSMVGDGGGGNLSSQITSTVQRTVQKCLEFADSSL
jgi:hypothetical protein